MDSWTALFRLGKHKRKRYVEYQLLARDFTDARSLALKLIGNETDKPEKAVLVSLVREDDFGRTP